VKGWIGEARGESTINRIETCNPFYGSMTITSTISKYDYEFRARTLNPQLISNLKPANPELANLEPVNL